MALSVFRARNVFERARRRRRANRISSPAPDAARARLGLRRARKPKSQKVEIVGHNRTKQATANKRRCGSCCISSLLSRARAAAAPASAQVTRRPGEAKSRYDWRRQRRRIISFPNLISGGRLIFVSSRRAPLCFRRATSGQRKRAKSLSGWLAGRRKAALAR